MINTPVFFTETREMMRRGANPLADQQAGMKCILDEWERRHLADTRWLAYIFATAYHETAFTMQPIDENGGNDYFFRMYDPEGERGAFARQNGNTERGDGVRYHGRGYPQLTWRSNYRKMGTLLGVDLEAHPEKAKEHPWAEQIMFEGMIREIFTGVGLDRYFNATKDDPVDARQIVNGHDCADAIAGYHRSFLAAIKKAAAGTS